MPPGELSITCPGCGAAARVPFAAVRRDNFYCPQCGKNIPLANAQADQTAAGDTPRPRARNTYRPTRRR